MWLRHAFPFGLLSSSDSFTYTDDEWSVSSLPVYNSLTSSVQRSAEFSSPFSVTSEFSTSTLKIQPNVVTMVKSSPNSTVNVVSASPSPDIKTKVEIENYQNQSSSPDDLNRSITVSSLPDTPKQESAQPATQYPSTVQSSSPLKLNVFSKIKKLIPKGKKESVAHSEVNPSVTSFPRKRESISPVRSVLNGLKSHLKIRSSSTEKERTCPNVHSNVAVEICDIAENMTVNLTEIVEHTNDKETVTVKEKENGVAEQESDKSEDVLGPKSEGFEVRVQEKSELEVSPKMESKVPRHMKKTHAQKFVSKLLHSVKLQEYWWHRVFLL